MQHNTHALKVSLKSTKVGIDRWIGIQQVKAVRYSTFIIRPIWAHGSFGRN